MKIVLDTNILISGILWTGDPHNIIKLAEQGNFTLCFTAEILDELSGVLKRDKFREKLKKRGLSISEIISYLELVGELYGPSEKIEVVKEDPDDNKFLECALSGEAEYIISGDKHLLNVGEYKGTRILSASDFLKRIS